MASVGHSAKLYQERRQPQIRSTLRGPGPYVSLWQNAVNHLTLEPPLPAPVYQSGTNCHSPTDTGKTQVWPHGDKYAP
jgi:hypothetical protein